MTIKVKRVYDAPSSEDGYRVLVDRLWPRGLRDDGAGVDLWLRDIAPSNDLRKWFAHDPEKWPAFEKRYQEELAGHDELLALLHDLESHHKTVTLVYGARDTEHNQALVLRDVVTRQPSHAH